MLRRVLAGPKADIAGALVKVSGMFHLFTHHARERGAKGPTL